MISDRHTSSSSARATGCNESHNVLILENELNLGGSERIFLEIFSRINTAHFRVKICCLKKGGFFKNAFTELGIPFYDGLMKHKYDIFAYRKLEKILEEENIEMIYTSLNPNTSIFCWLAKISRRVKKVVVAVHSTTGLKGGRLVPRYQKLFLSSVDRFIAVAHRQKQHLAESEGLDEDKIEVIHNGVDTKRFFPGSPDEALRRELGIDAAERVVTTVASLRPYKGLDVLIRAVPRVLEEFKDVRFVIVGDGPERANLDKLVRDCGVEGSVMFTGVRGDVEDILRLSKIFVLPSKLEAFPVSVLEAMASGLPVAATDVGSVRELIQDGQSGFVVAPMDVKALASGICRLLGSEETARDFGARGRQLVEEHYTLEDMCKKQEKVLTDVVCGQH